MRIFFCLCSLVLLLASFLAISLNFFKYLFYVHLLSAYLLTFILTEALLLCKILRLQWNFPHRSVSRNGRKGHMPSHLMYGALPLVWWSVVGAPASSISTQIARAGSNTPGKTPLKPPTEFVFCRSG